MPYPIERPTWESQFEPLFKAFDGREGVDSVDDLDWSDETTEWREDFQGTFGGQEADLGPPGTRTDVGKIVLPKTANRADHRADVIAASRGVNPSRRSGGTGGILDLARSMLGVDYVWGAEAKNGVDCSGLVYWVFNRAGFDIPRVTAQGYQSVFNYVPGDKDSLQAGDVVYFSYGRLGKGVVDHIGIYAGNGKMIDASSSNDKVVYRNVDWDNLVSGGRLKGAGEAVSDTQEAIASVRAKPKVRTTRTPVLNETSTVPSGLAGGAPDFTEVLASQMLPPATITRQQLVPGRAGGAEGSVKDQLRQGFRDAGRGDLARMVGTKAFQTWINQESGWRADVTSPANNHGLANDGLFQIWRGHDFNSNGQVSKMSPYEQAQIVARYFAHLTPAKIRQYAREISNGSYGGWG